MDITIQKRSVDLIINYLKHNVDAIPPYGYAMQKPALKSPATHSPLPRAVPEDEGVSSIAVKRFMERLELDRTNVSPHGILVLRRGKVLGEAFYKPYTARQPQMVYSMSKSFTSAAIGFLIDEGRIKTSDKVADILACSSLASKYQKMLTVEHVLTMSSGNRFNEVGSMLDADWQRMFIESLPKFEPGTAFEYNSLNTYILSAIVRRVTGMGLFEYLTPRLFEPLGFDRCSWETCPRGIEKGGWGFNVTLEDAAKLGLLYMNKGVFNGKRILSEEYCSLATSVRIPTPNGEAKRGYGYQIWMNELGDGAFNFSGVFGQFVFCFPKYDAIVAVYAGNSRLIGRSPLLKYVQELLSSMSDKAYKRDDRAYNELLEYQSSVVFAPALSTRLFQERLSADESGFSAVASILDGCEYKLEGNTGGLFPTIVQGVHGNYTMGTDMLRFKKTQDGLDVTFYEYRERNVLHIKAGAGYNYGYVTMHGETELVGVTCRYYILPQGRVLLALIVPFAETPHTRIVYMDIRADKIDVSFDETPSVGDAVQLLLDMLGITDRAAIKLLMPVARTENVEVLMRKFTTPSASGVRVNHNDLLPAPALLLPEGQE